MSSTTAPDPHPDIVVGGGKARRGRRKEILEIAGRQFAEKGYGEATVRDIGEAAGILSGSLYRHFDSKESILEELLRSYLDELVELYEPITVETEGSAAAALQKLIRLACEIVRAHRVEVLILHDNYRMFHRVSRFTFVRVMQRRINSFWLRVLEEGRATGEFRREMNPKLATRVILGGIETTVRWYDPRGQFTPDEIAEHYATLHLSGLVAD
jgi:AcrR family transcriptional regulator